MRRILTALTGISILVLLAGRASATETGSGQVATQTAHEAAETSLAAAVAIFGADPDPDCQPGQRRVCLRADSTPEEAAAGIARFGVGGSGPEGQGAFLGVLGRDPSGEWRFWFGTQNVVYQLLTLPGEMIVCAGGDGLNVRAAPSTDAPIVGTLSDLTIVTAVQFTLTQPGVQPSQTADQVVGHGWYRLSAPLAGWSSSLYLSNAEIDAYSSTAPCAIHDIFAGR